MATPLLSPLDGEILERLSPIARTGTAGARAQSVSPAAVLEQSPRLISWRNGWDRGRTFALIADVETDRKGVPVLLKQYLKLGGELVAFHVDPALRRCAGRIDHRGPS